MARYTTYQSIRVSLVYHLCHVCVTSAICVMWLLLRVMSLAVSPAFASSSSSDAYQLWFYCCLRLPLTYLLFVCFCAGKTEWTSMNLTGKIWLLQSSCVNSSRDSRAIQNHSNTSEHVFICLACIVKPKPNKLASASLRRPSRPWAVRWRLLVCLVWEAQRLKKCWNILIHVV